MEFLFPVLVILVLAIAILARGWIARSQPADADLLEKYVKDRSLRVTSVTVSHNHWRYWLRGKVTLSNLARMYVVDAVSDTGQTRRLHLAFDPMRKAEGVILLQEEQL